MLDHRQKMTKNKYGDTISKWSLRQKIYVIISQPNRKRLRTHIALKYFMGQAVYYQHKIQLFKLIENISTTWYKNNYLIRIWKVFYIVVTVEQVWSVRLFKTLTFAWL